MRSTSAHASPALVWHKCAGKAAAAGGNIAQVLLQEVDQVVARVRGRENEQHDALEPVLAYVNANMQVCCRCTPLQACSLAVS